MAMTAKLETKLVKENYYGEYDDKCFIKARKFPLPIGRLLGSGQFSSVFTSLKHKNRVFKVLHTDRDPGYIAFVVDLLHTSAIQKNPHLPVIYSVTCYIFNDAQIMVVELEKLSTCINLDDSFQWVELFHIEGNDARKKHWLLLNNDIQEACMFLFYTYLKYKKELKLQYDLHDENIMLRDDGTVVITDPYARLTWT
jgi:hypothetical protein